jgi:hypothetical protein
MRVRNVILAALLGVLATGTMTAAAHASDWLINGKTLTELSLKEEKISGSGGPVELTVPAKNIRISCEKAAITGVILPGGSDKVEAQLSKCSVFNLKTGEKLTPCGIKEPAVLTTKSELIYVGGNFYDKLNPQSEKSMGTITITGALCVPQGTYSVSGAVAGKITMEPLVKRTEEFSGAISETVNTALVKEGKSALALSFGASAATLSGKLTLELSGGNAGGEWTRAIGTKLCTELEALCTAAHTYPVKTAVKVIREADMEFLYGGTSIVCEESKLEGFTENSGLVLAGTFSTVNFNMCESAGNACPVTALKTPYGFEIGATEFGDGFLTLQALRFKMQCGGLNCVYTLGRLTFDIHGGVLAKLLREFHAMFKEPVESNEACATIAIWQGIPAVEEKILYKFLEPAPLFVTE